VGEQFAVSLFSEDGKRRYARRFVRAQEGIRAFDFMFAISMRKTPGSCVWS
jgi:hypothetical protein